MNAAAPSEVVMDKTVAETDIIVDVASEIENLTKKQAFKLVPELLESVDFSYFKLGGVLSVIQENNWWHGEADNFKKFIPEKFGLHWRKGYYLIKLYEELVEAGIPWDKVSGLGWTKLSKLAPILTVDNVDEWVEIAESTNSVTLKERVKSATDNGSTSDSSDVTTMTFTVHADEKETIDNAVDQAMKDANTEFKAVALEAVCLNFLAGGNTNKSKPVSLKGTMEKYKPQQVLETFEAIWPEIEVSAEMDPDDYDE